jgi:heme/copper-type cytochrome/quinol oxidase subunit 2
MKNNSKKYNIILILSGIALLWGLFYVFMPKEESLNNAPEPATQQQTVSPTEVSNIKTFDLVINGKKITSGDSVLKVNLNDEVTINVTSDEAEELHIHGYDNSVELVPSQKAELKFTANISGRFPFELENSGTELGSIEVQPK